MIITAINQQVKIKGRYSIFIDGKFAFGISEQGLIDNEIRIGREFTKSELDNLEEKAELDKLYNMTLGLIARRPRSMWEVDTYLRNKKLDEPSRDQIIKKLTSKRLLDDYDFTLRWIENRRLLKPISYKKLKLELMQKRVATAIIEDALRQDETSEYDVILIEVAKKRKQSRYQDDQKLMQYLARQGYSYEDIKRSLSDDTD